MKLINHITDIDFGLKETNDNFDNWNVRQAMRGVLLNDKNDI